MSEDDAAPIFFTIGHELFVWEMGSSAPRKLASSRLLRDTILLGDPSGGTVPVVLQGFHRASLRLLSAEGGPELIPAWPLAGWRSVPFTQDHLPLLPPCEKGATGALFRGLSSYRGFAMELDGQKLADQYSVSFDVRVSEASACIAAINATGWRMDTSQRKLGLLMVDVARQSGRGVETGRGGRVRKLECRLE